MISKLFIFILTLSIVGNANANSPWDPRFNKAVTINDGFYGGLTLGYNNLVGLLNRTLNFNTSDRVTSVGEKGVALGVFAGYQKIIDGKLYIAAEGFYQYADIHIEKEENTLPGYINYFTYIDNTHKGGMVGKFGFVHSNNIFYLKTGVVLSHFVLGFRDNVRNPFLVAARTSKVSKIQTGVIMGGGIDYFINRNFAIGMEYEVVNYPSMDFKNQNGGSPSFKSTSHTFQVRFKYTV